MKLLALTHQSLGFHEAHAHGIDIRYESAFERASFDGGAEITAISYVAEGDSRRPVVFVTNGGPGSSSAWMHLGLFGPRRVRIDDPINPPKVPPFELEDNPHLLLDLCDLVLIDPAGCGLSSAPDEASAPEFFSVDGDALSIALFMERWVDAHARWNAPLFFIGESYGTVRACALLDALAGGPSSAPRRAMGINLSGMAFLGTAFSSAPSALDAPPVEPFALSLSACAATSAYHNGSNPRAAFEEAWNLTDTYVAALFRGRSLDPATCNDIAERLSPLLGIAAEKLVAGRLRLDVGEFRRHVVDGCEVGAYDSRYVMRGIARGGGPSQLAGDPVADDPAMGSYVPVFSAGERALREELGLPAGTYRTIDFAVNGRWDYSCRRPPLASLENSCRRNPSMRILFSSGLYDLVCPPGAIRYLVQNSSLPDSQVTVREYESGHMPYLGKDSMRELEIDLRALIGGRLL